MKPRITTDLLRGVLAAYAARECYMYSRVSPSFVRDHSGMFALAAIFVAAIIIAAYLFVLVALLVQRAPKATFVCLLLLAVMPLFALDQHGWVITERFVVRQLVAIGAVVIAYIYYRRVCSTQRSNQSLEPTAGRCEVHI